MIKVFNILLNYALKYEIHDVESKPKVPQKYHVWKCYRFFFIPKNRAKINVRYDVVVTAWQLDGPKNVLETLKNIYLAFIDVVSFYLCR